MSVARAWIPPLALSRELPALGRLRRVVPEHAVDIIGFVPVVKAA